MSLNWAKPGFNSVPEYQSSGNAFIVENGTSARTVTLNYVTRAVVVCANEDAAAVTFYDGNNNTKAVTVPKGVHRFEVKVVKFATNNKSMSIVAELTNIPAENGDYVQLFADLGTTA